MLSTITHIVPMTCKCLHCEMSSKLAVGELFGSSHHDVTILSKGLHVQVLTSCPSSMSSELPESRKQHHGFGLRVKCYALPWPRVFITFLRDYFVEEDLCTLVSVYRVA